MTNWSIVPDEEEENDEGSDMEADNDDMEMMDDQSSMPHASLQDYPGDDLLPSLQQILLPGSKYSGLTKPGVPSNNNRVSQSKQAPNQCPLYLLYLS